MTARVLQDRPATPVLTAQDWGLPEVNDVTVGRGTRVVSVDLPGSELVVVRVLLAAPMSAERRDGLFSLLSGLWAEGPASMSGLDFATALESLGATTGGAAGYEGMSVDLAVPVRNLPGALSLAVSPLADPGYAERSVDRELRSHAAAFGQLLEDPSSRADLQSAQLAFAASCRASRPAAGTPRSLRGCTVEELRVAHQQHVRPEFAVVVMAGNLGSLNPRELVEEAFARWETAAGPQPPRVVVDELEPGPDPGARHLTRRPGAVQTTLKWARCVTGFSPRQWAALELALSILAGGPTSRLTLSLRERRGLTYGIHGGATRWTASSGALSIRTAVEAGSTAEAVSETERILGEALDRGFTADELDQAVRHRLGSDPIGMQSAAGVVGSLADALAMGDGPGAIAEGRQTICDLRPAEVLDALRAALTDGQLTLASVGPQEAGDAP